MLATAALAAMPLELEEVLDFDGLDAEDPGVVEVDAVPHPPAEPADEDLQTTVDIEDWERLADCESGDWTAAGDPEPGSARWDYGIDYDHGDHFQGGLNFHPDTWDAFRDDDMPAHAGRASRADEIEVAEEVLDEQGWDAWPVCSEMLDLRS